MHKYLLYVKSYGGRGAVNFDIPATLSNSKEELPRWLIDRFARKKFIFSTAAGYMATACNFTLNRVFANLAFFLVNTQKVRFPFLVEA